MKGPVVENVVLTVHLILAVLLIGVVLLQRSEGGGLGMGGGGGGTGVMTGRQAANALSRLTWILAGAFLITSLSLTVIAARNASSGSIIDQLNLGGGQSDQSETTLPGIGGYTPPPAAGQPIMPPVPGAAAPATGSSDATPALDSSVPASSGDVTPAPVTPPAAETPAPAADGAATDTPATDAPAATPVSPAPAPTN